MTVRSLLELPASKRTIPEMLVERAAASNAPADVCFDDTYRGLASLTELIASADYQTELAQYNIELNVPPRPLPGDAALELETELRDSLNAADRAARQVELLAEVPLERGRRRGGRGSGSPAGA